MTTTDPGPGPDPLAAVRKGDRRNVFLVRGTGTTCNTRSARGYYCSRTVHPPEWKHIAAGHLRVVEIWGGADDA